MLPKTVLLVTFVCVQFCSIAEGNLVDDLKKKLEEIKNETKKDEERLVELESRLRADYELCYDSISHLEKNSANESSEVAAQIVQLKKLRAEIDNLNLNLTLLNEEKLTAERKADQVKLVASLMDIDGPGFIMKRNASMNSKCTELSKAKVIKAGAKLRMLVLNDDGEIDILKVLIRQALSEQHKVLHAISRQKELIEKQKADCEQQVNNLKEEIKEIENDSAKAKASVKKLTETIKQLEAEQKAYEEAIQKDRDLVDEFVPLIRDFEKEYAPDRVCYKQLTDMVLS